MFSQDLDCWCDAGAIPLGYEISKLESLRAFAMMEPEEKQGQAAIT